MKFLQILNAVTLAFGAAMGVILAVVCVLYGAHLSTAPRLSAEMPRLLALTGLFLALAVAGGFAFLGHRRGWVLRWLAQAAPLLPVAGIAVFIASLRN